MTFPTQVPLADGCHLGSGCGYPAPGYPSSFRFTPLFTIGSFEFTKPMLLAIICAGLVIAFFWAAFAKPKLVPRGAQNIGELGIMFVRDQILRPMMGKRRPIPISPARGQGTGRIDSRSPAWLAFS